MRANPKAVAALAFLAVVFTAGSGVAGSKTVLSHEDCFLTSNSQGWTAPGDGDVLYLRIRPRDIFEVKLTPGSHVRRDPDHFLVNRVRRSSWICSPLDLDLTLTDRNGFRMPLIARSLRKLNSSEVATIPRKDLP